MPRGRRTIVDIYQRPMPSNIYIFDTGRDDDTWLNHVPDADMLMLVSATCFDNGEGADRPHGPEGHIYLEMLSFRRTPRGVGRAVNIDVKKIRKIKLRGPTRNDGNWEWIDYEKTKGREPPRQIMNYFGPHYPVGGPIFEWPAGRQDIGIRVYESDSADVLGIDLRSELGREHDYFGDRNNRHLPVIIRKDDTLSRPFAVRLFGGRNHLGMVLEFVTVRPFHPSFGEIDIRTFWDAYLRGVLPGRRPFSSLRFDRDSLSFDEIQRLDKLDAGAGALLFSQNRTGMFSKLYCTVHTQASDTAKYLIIWAASTFRSLENQRPLHRLQTPIILGPGQRFDLTSMERSGAQPDILYLQKLDRGPGHLGAEIVALEGTHFAVPMAAE